MSLWLLKKERERERETELWNKLSTTRDRASSVPSTGGQRAWGLGGKAPAGALVPPEGQGLTGYTGTSAVGVTASQGPARITASPSGGVRREDLVSVSWPLVPLCQMGSEKQNGSPQRYRILIPGDAELVGLRDGGS